MGIFLLGHPVELKPVRQPSVRRNQRSVAWAANQKPDQSEAELSGWLQSRQRRDHWPHAALRCRAIGYYKHFKTKWDYCYTLRCCGGWKYLQAGFSRLHRPCNKIDFKSPCVKISAAGCVALTLADKGRIVSMFTRRRFSSFSISAKTCVCHDEKSVLWVKLNNSPRWRSEPGRSVQQVEVCEGWRYNVIIWFCNPKVSSLAPVQRCCALNRLEIEETTRIWPQLTASSHPTSHSQTRPWHRYSAIFKNYLLKDE